VRPLVERIIVHQFDPARPSPGGIDTCLRGICEYAPEGSTLAIVGVDTGAGPEGRSLGRWETYKFGSNTIRFLPVVRLDPADQSRRVPHSVRLVVGLARYVSRLPRSRYVQAHRMDTALACLVLLRRPLVYMIHTQENGLTGQTSDSFWRSAAKLHQRLERWVVGAAERVFVFNEAYSKIVRRWNSVAEFSPTWFDPALIRAGASDRDARKVVWAGRLETPKDPELAISAFRRLQSGESGGDWTLEVLGSGTLQPSIELAAAAGDLPGINVRGRVAPDDVARIMGQSGVFLMTSHPGYEGYPRVLVEAMASGLQPVVTDGSDTGGLINNGMTGYVTGRQPEEIAARMRDVTSLNRDVVRSAVENLSAPTIVGRLFGTLE
jgi:glycosyltransferase involved in cell wall biosynthesis